MFPDLSYLWGIETELRNHIWNEQNGDLSYLWGIETCPNNPDPVSPPWIYLTYEELKPEKRKAILFSDKRIYLTYEELKHAQTKVIPDIPPGIYLTYEELKLILYM